MFFRYFTSADIILVAVLLILSLVSFISVRHFTPNGKHVVVEVEGRPVLELSFDKDVTETVTGPLGETVIVIENGTVRIQDSPCPNHYCVRMGKLRHSGEIAVCVPNRVVVTISGGDETGSFDSVTQ